MLSDLEQRHSHRQGQDEIVIDGLAPVANTGFAHPRIPYNFLLVCFFVIAVIVAGYGYWNSLSGQGDPVVTLPGIRASRAQAGPVIAGGRCPRTE